MAVTFSTTKNGSIRERVSTSSVPRRLEQVTALVRTRLAEHAVLVRELGAGECDRVRIGDRDGDRLGLEHAELACLLLGEQSSAQSKQTQAIS